MDKDSVFDEIFSNDPFGLLDIKPTSAPARNADERLYVSFQEINDFYAQNNREPAQGNGMQEHTLYSRLKGIRENQEKIALLKSQDTYELLKVEAKEINSIDDIFNDDSIGLLEDDSHGLFDFKHISPLQVARAESDFVATRKPCKDFAKYEEVFKSIQKDLKEGKRKLVDFKQGNLRENTFYVHNGVLFLLEEIKITQKEHYREDGTRVREDGRTRCIFENGTESNMRKRSAEKILYANGKVVSENTDKVNEHFQEKFGNITDEDQEAGFIYVLKSKSSKQEIKEIQNLYKIGFSKGEVEERIKNASQEPTYLMAEVRIVMTYKCYNMNPQKLELLLHNFFGSSCLNIDVFDSKGNRHTPREWFIAPLSVIEEAIMHIITGDIVNYRYDGMKEELMEK